MLQSCCALASLGCLSEKLESVVQDERLREGPFTHLQLSTTEWDRPVFVPLVTA